MVIHGMTDVGEVRKNNQDYFLIQVYDESNQGFAVVCDGMGGAAAGNVASVLAADTFFAGFENFRKDAMDNLYLQQNLQAALDEANRAVFEKSVSDNQFAGMGTTLVCAVLQGTQLFALNVGDSRLYRISKDGIFKVTKDHSMVEELLLDGILTEEQARRHPDRNIITRAVGTEKTVRCDFFKLELLPSEKVLLCSDGLSNVVDDAELQAAVCSGQPLNVITENLIAAAKKRGAPDNVTVCILDPAL